MNNPINNNESPVIPDWLDDANLRPQEFRVFCHVCNQGRCEWTLEQIAMVCRMRRKTVQRALKDLEKRSLIMKFTRPGYTNLYVLSLRFAAIK